MTRIEKVIKQTGGRPALICLSALSQMPDEEMEPKPYEVQEGVAIIHIQGLLGNDSECCDTTYTAIQSQVMQAVSDQAVKAILLNIDSPGGYTDKAFETASRIAAASAKKPCVAVASNMAYSAAYLLASQANKIYVSPVTGGVGSVGVYCAHVDMSGFLAQIGFAVTLISAGKGKTDGNPYEPLSAEAKKKMQTEINRLYGEFVGAVSRGRGLLPQAVIALGADCYDGAKQAIGAGLADLPGDLETAWVALAAEPRQPMPMPGMPGASTSSVASATNLPKEGIRMADVSTAAPAEATQPAAAAETPLDSAALVTAAHTDGYAAAAAIVDLCTIAGKSGLAADFIAKKLTREQVSAELLKLRAAESGPEIASHILPDAGTGTEAKPSQSPVVKACEAIAIHAKEANKR